MGSKDRVFVDFVFLYVLIFNYSTQLVYFGIKLTHNVSLRVLNFNIFLR